MPRYHPIYRAEDDPEQLLAGSERDDDRRGRHATSRDNASANANANAKLMSLSQSRRRFFRRRPPVVFVVIWAAFTFLLCANFFIFAKERAPEASSSYIGWQAFLGTGDSQSASGTLDELAVAGGNTTSYSSDTGAALAPSFPLDVYAPLVPNPIPLTEVTVHRCLPGRLRSCKPPTTASEDAKLGPWTLVPRPLDGGVMSTYRLGASGLGGAMSKIFGALDTKYLFYRRSRRKGVQSIIDLKLIEVGQDAPTETQAGWYRVKQDLRASYMRMWQGRKGMHLYYRLSKESADDDGEDGHWERQLQGQPFLDEAITELDIIYGHDNPPWPGFFSVGMVSESNKALAQSAVRLTARKKPKPNPRLEAQPTFNRDGTFKIMQIADLHMSVEEEPCRGVGWGTPSKPCHSAVDTFALLDKWLDAEKPDLVVLTGDQLNGQSSSWDARSVLPRTLEPIIKRKIPWAGILGNHDSQTTSVSRQELALLMSRMPYSLTRVGPPQLHEGNGAGNYYIRLMSPTPDHTNVFNLYFFDSGDRQNWKIPFRQKGSYDSIARDQIDWFLQQSDKVKKILRPYRPDGGADLPAQNWTRGHEEEPSVERRWDAGAAQGQTLAKPNAFVFVHIPLPQFFNVTADTVRFGPDRAETSGIRGTQAKADFFEALLQQKPSDRDVRLVDSGHMHVNADCERISTGSMPDENPIWTCFGGGSSYAGYGQSDFPRMSRVFLLSEFGEKAESWSRFEDGEVHGKGLLWDDTTARATT
ncbi:unnamed protein product [Jaminaea pallidilutea]